MADKAVRLSLYLARENRTRESLLRAEYREGGSRALDRLAATDGLPFPFDAYMRRTPARPGWIEFAARHFDVADIRNYSTAFVLLFDTAGRSWALSFGHGWHAIDPSAVEPGFGLRVCVNCIDPAAIRSMANRRVGPVTRQQVTHISKASHIAELGVILDQDWVRTLAGRSGTEGLTGTLSGSDAFAFSSKRPIEEMDTICEKLLERFDSDDYKEAFGFIDQFRPLRAGEVIALGLDEALHTRIKERNETEIHLAPTDVPDEHFLNGYRVWASGETADIEELEPERLFAALAVLPEVDSPLDDVRIAPLDDNDEPSVRDSLRRYAVTEVRLGDDLYVHSLGAWFKIDTDYAASITRQVADIEDVTDLLDIPPWRRETTGKHAGKHHETEFNKRAANMKHWILFDDDPIRHGGPDQKIELCDLLSDDDRHICLKRAKSSATLSHLWAQAAIVCDLYRQDEVFVQKAVDKLHSLAPGRKFPDLTRPLFVYAIGTADPRPLSESLFFFSKLALVASYTELRGKGASVALARVVMVA